MELKQEKCVACTPNSKPVTTEEIALWKPQLLHWEIIEQEGQLRLQKIYKFPDFQQALAFTNAVGYLAEDEAHHPALLTEWGKVTVTWWTHSINGLHQNDFIMAAKTDAIASS